MDVSLAVVLVIALFLCEGGLVLVAWMFDRWMRSKEQREQKRRSWWGGDRFSDN